MWPIRVFVAKMAMSPSDQRLVSRLIMPSFVVHSPLPKYRAAESLRRQLIEHLLSGGFRVGDPFLSDREVMEAAGRSRTAVRRALEHLQREGWIERRGGVGTFVGPRVAMPVHRNRGLRD